jgi:hypothetical protein
MKKKQPIRAKAIQVFYDVFFFSFFLVNHRDENFIEKEKKNEDRKRGERENEFVKQNSEAQIE